MDGHVDLKRKHHSFIFFFILEKNVEDEITDYKIPLRRHETKPVETSALLVLVQFFAAA